MTITPENKSERLTPPWQLIDRTMPTWACDTLGKYARLSRIFTLRARTNFRDQIRIKFNPSKPSGEVSGCDMVCCGVCVLAQLCCC